MDVTATYFITGANGFVGGCLARELNRKGHNITLLFHRADDHPFLKDTAAERVWGDILDPATYIDHLDENTTVIHCAARVSFSRAERDSVWETNYEGTRALLNACRKQHVSSFVFLSSGAVWGTTRDTGQLITERLPQENEGRNAYAASKIKAESACRESLQDGMDIRIINPATIFGAGDYRLTAGGRVVTTVARHGARLAPPGGTSWIDIEDAIRGILLVIEKGRRGENYILSAGHIAFRDLFEHIAKSCGREVAPRKIPSYLEHPAVLVAWVLHGAGSLFPGFSFPASEQIRDSFRYKYFSAQKAEKELGFLPHVSLETSLRETVAFSRTAGFLPTP